MSGYTDVKQIIEDIKNLEKTNPELREYFKNQQRFIHLYLLSKGASITAKIIDDIVSTLDRGFAPKTYYSLRRELYNMEWIEEDETLKSTNEKGPIEISHKIKMSRLSEFQNKIIQEVSVVDRPFSMNKYHLFEMGLRFSKLNRQKIAELESYTEKYLTTEDAFVFPTFLTKNISDELIAIAKAPQSYTLTNRIKDWLADVKDEMILLSKSPQFGPWIPQTRTGIEEEKVVLALGDGKISVNFSWYSSYQSKPAYIIFSWSTELNILTSFELWARFTNPDTEEVFSEIFIGDKSEGDKKINEKELNFDPSKGQWKLSFIIKEKNRRG